MASASASTLNRMELGEPEAAAHDRYKHIVARPEAFDELLAELFVESHARAPREVWLDLDATDDPLHGHQEGRFFHGYYRCYCYLLLYIFCGEHLLCARLRASNQDASAGSVEELERIVGRLRRHWPRTRIHIRGDSGFCRDSIMRWCEEHDVGYVLGLARNRRLVRAVGAQMHEAHSVHRRTGMAARRFRDFTYRTRKSWSRRRRVVRKAEHLSKRANPRFVVTNLSPRKVAARRLYEKLYCARGEMENRIKDQQLDLLADRTSSHTMRANQLRLYFSSFAYVLMHGLRRLGTDGHRLGPRPVLHASAEAVEDRRTNQDHGPSGVAVVLPNLSVCQDLYQGAGKRTKRALVESVWIACGPLPHARPVIGATPRPLHVWIAPSTFAGPPKIRHIALHLFRTRTDCGNRRRSFRYVDEISVIHKKRDSKSGIGDGCGLTASSGSATGETTPGRGGTHSDSP